MRRSTFEIYMRGLASAGLLATAAAAQSKTDAAPAPDRPRLAQTDAEEPTERRPLTRRLQDIIDEVRVENAPARQAFEWWSASTGIRVLIDWDAMQRDGIDPEAPVTLELRDVPAGQVLGLLMQQTGGEQDLVYEITPWYARVMTKPQANRRPVLRVYDVRDLLHPIARPGDSGQIGLSGGGTIGGNRTRNDNRDESNEDSRDERGEELADLIRNTIEPEVWEERGGGATIRYYQGRLVVKAPLYVHAQIGVPLRPPRLYRAAPATQPGK